MIFQSLKGKLCDISEKRFVNSLLAAFELRKFISLKIISLSIEIKFYSN